MVTNITKLLLTQINELALLFTQFQIYYNKQSNLSTIISTFSKIFSSYVW